MAIRFVDKASIVGRLVATLQNATSAFSGTFTAAPARTGRIQAQLQPATALISGFFSPAANRTGAISATLQNATSTIFGQFTPAGSTATQDWVTRSTAPGVVWAHGFERKSEVDAFRWTGENVWGNDPNSTQSSSLQVTWDATDGFDGGGCLKINRPAGTNESAGWWRPFSALNAPGNGRLTNDAAAGGAVALKTWNPNNRNQNGDWVDGYYAHQDYRVNSNFDGGDFYIQCRVKISGSRYTGGNQNYDGKIVFVATTGLTPYQEILIQARGDKRFRIYTAFGSPGPLEFMFDPQDMATSPIRLQPGGAYNDTCLADVETAGNCWFWTPDEWITLLYRCRAGHGVANNWGPADNLIQIWAARENDSAYTKIYDKANYQLFFHPSKPIGWNAFQASTYANGQNLPQAYNTKYAQVIFSRQFIPPPTPAPAWFRNQPEKTWSTPVTNTLSAVNPGGIGGNHAAICTAWTGGTVDQTRGELLLAANGGHGDYAGNEVYSCSLRASSPAWTRLTDPSNLAAIAGGNAAHLGPANYGDGKPRAVHGWNRCVFGNGRIWYAGMDGFYPDGAWSLACYSFNRSTLQWQYHGIPTNDTSGSFSWQGGMAAYDRVGNRIYSLSQYCTNSSGGAYSVDASTGAFTTHNWDFAPNRGGDWMVVAHDVSPRLMIHSDFRRGTIWVLNLENIGAGWSMVTPTGTAGMGDGTGAVYHAPSRSILTWKDYGASIRKLKIPNPLTGSWVWTTITPAASNTVVPTAGPPNGTFSKFNIIEDMGNGQSALCMVLSTTGQTYVYKLPKGELL